MNILQKQVSTLFFGLIVLFPGIMFASEDVIWEAGANLYFKYTDQDKSSFGKNDHPVELKAKEISAALEVLKIKEKNSGVPEEEFKPVFTTQQTDMLGEYLAKGLMNAKPDQDIIFAMQRSVKRLFPLKAKEYFVAGRAFYKENKLNIIIGDYDRLRDDGYEAAVDPTHVGIVRYNFDHGRRSKGSKGFKKSILEVGGVENKQLNKTTRADWLVIDVNVALESQVRKMSMRKEEEMARKRKELREILGSEEAAHEKDINQGEETKGKDETVRSIKATSSLEERLTTLKRLKDKGLITDEEYAQKRKQILDEL